jgi:hypothetical protein
MEHMVHPAYTQNMNVYAYKFAKKKEKKAPHCVYFVFKMLIFPCQETVEPHSHFMKEWKSEFNSTGFVVPFSRKTK